MEIEVSLDWPLDRLTFSETFGLASPLQISVGQNGHLSVTLCTQEYFEQWDADIWDQIFGPDCAKLSSNCGPWTRDYQSILATSATHYDESAPTRVSCASRDTYGRLRIDAYDVERERTRP